MYQMNVQINTIVFDIGGVIVKKPPNAVFEEIAEAAGVDFSTFEPLFWKLRDRWDIGDVSAHEYYKRVFEELKVPVSGQKIDELWRFDMSHWIQVDTSTEKLMQDLKTQGYRIAILSNISQELLEFSRARFSFFKIADVSVFSSDVHQLKPNAEIYQTLLSALGNPPPSSIVFLDDKHENIDGAAACGITGIIWLDAEQAKRELRTLGVHI